MIEAPNFVWTCPDCGHREFGYENGIVSFSVWIRTKRCPKCDSLMEESPTKMKGPEPENPNKKY